MSEAAMLKMFYEIFHVSRLFKGGAPVFDPELGERIGTVTSGCISPCLNDSIAMAYVDSGAPVFDPELGEQIGTVTSGCISPCLNDSIAMAYVDSRKAKIGTTLMVEVMKKRIETRVTSLPFVPSHYAS
ncbi:unnamed protein product [Protopolystoma xenopodis]|uniref:Aminomethyltransferase C-terminal domain-containing protein n=1 Tax=Protopolystoma xenopodis TaxID=117903 RepID=A0A3S5B799_9PLAT|nr:unnamed protein product [Protopolystoma xenopodis]